MPIAFRNSPYLMVPLLLRCHKIRDFHFPLNISSASSEIVKLLKQKGANFVAGTNSKPIEGVDTVAINFSDIKTLKDAMKDIDTLFMLLPADPNMVTWGKNIIEAAKQSGVKHILRSSSAIAYSAKDYNFMQQIQLSDKDVIESGINYTIILPQFFMQNLSTSMVEDYKSKTLYLPAGDGKIGWVDTRDIALVSVEILLNPTKYNGQKIVITGEEALSYDEIIKQMNQVLDLDTTYVAVPDEMAIEGMQERGFPPYFIDVLMDLNRAIAKGCADELTDSVESITGKKPISFREFVQDHKESWL